MKNGEERQKTFTDLLTETSRKRYESTSARIFFTETIFSPKTAEMHSIGVRDPLEQPPFAYLLNTPPFCVFYWFLSETLWNFTDYVTTPIFFLECFETLRITQQRSFWLPECCRTSRIAQQCLFWLLECCETLWIMQRCLFRGFRREQTRFKDRPQVVPDEIRVWQLPLFTYLLMVIKGK